MESGFAWNIALFHILNVGDAPNGAVVFIARALAEYAPWLAIVVSVVVWLMGTVAMRRALMIAGIALGLGLATNFTLAWAMYAPRPFELGLGHTLLAHGQDSSFPSDHATFLWSLGFALALGPALRGLGGALVVVGLMTAWARVYLGVHFPLDMAASLGISLLAATLAHGFSQKLDGVFFQPVERLNAILLRPFVRGQN